MAKELFKTSFGKRDGEPSQMMQEMTELNLPCRWAMHRELCRE